MPISSNVLRSRPLMGGGREVCGTESVFGGCSAALLDLLLCAPHISDDNVLVSQLEIG